MKIRILFYTGIVLLALFCFWYFYLRTEREDRLIKEGNTLVKKIENYRQRKGKLPDSLGDIGIHSKGDWDSYGEGADAIYYE